ncbi:MAG: efflux RND transporter periplasmic adaptor subunit [Planctomycetota bacterium]
MKHATVIPLCLVFAIACAKQPDPDASGAKAPPATQAPTNRIDIPPTVRQNLGIEFAQVEVRHVAAMLRVPGEFELQPAARHEYRMTLPGLVDLQVDQYEPVEAGRVLFRFRSPAWPELAHEIVAGEQEIAAARADIAVAESRIEEASQRLGIVRGRIEALAQADFRKAELEATAAELEASLPRLEAERQLAETRARNADRSRAHGLHLASMATGIPEEDLEKKVSLGGVERPAYRTLDWIEVRATEPGVVEALAVTNGSFAETSALVLSVVQPDKVRFRAIALQADLASLLMASEAEIVPPRSPGLSMTDRVPARVTLGLEANPRERTVTLLAVPKGSAPWVRAGVSAFLEVLTGATDSPQLTVPSAAIVQDGLQHVLFRRDPDSPDQVIRIEADLGLSDGRWTVLHSGVRRGDEVVVHGAYELKLASQRAGAGAQGGHFHADGSFHDE